MNEEMKKDYNNSVDFWNQALNSNPEDYEGEINQEEDWKEIGSEQLLKLICDEVQGWDNILDYGCGAGWAATVFAKNGAKKIKGVDVAENAINSARYYVKAFQSEEKIELEAVSVDWLENQPADQYDHAFSCNVLDVVPDEVSEGIIKGLANVCKKEATLLIGMNSFFEGESLTKEGCSYRDHYLYVNDVLRVNNHTDEEWTQLFSKYFKVNRIEHYKWDVEAKEGRRLFYLSGTSIDH